jgi:hypothetical protein
MRGPHGITAVVVDSAPLVSTAARDLILLVSVLRPTFPNP